MRHRRAGRSQVLMLALALGIGAAAAAVIYVRRSHMLPAGQEPGPFDDTTLAASADLSYLNATISIADAKALAKTENKPVLLVFSASWCPTCRLLKNDVLAHPDVATTLRASAVTVSVDTDARKADADAFGVSKLPAMVLLREGKEPQRREGYVGPEDLMAWVRSPA